MFDFDAIIIGAGIIGLSIAEKLSHRYSKILVIEKESGFGQHTSSRNSEVIHSGIYYPKDSLKAKLCVEGNQLLYSFLDTHALPYRKSGKLVIATQDSEKPLLKELLAKGEANGVKGLKIISQEEVLQREPNFKSKGALWVPSTGIMDTHSIMRKMESLAQRNGVDISYNTEVSSIKKIEDSYHIAFLKDPTIITSPIVINCAGLWSDKISSLVGIDGYKLHWCKGEYFKTTKLKNVRHLVYPIPDPELMFLGIHTRTNLNGDLFFGPNANYVDKLDYSVSENSKKEFFNSIKRFLDIEMDDLSIDTSGIRPKLQERGGKQRDFVIKNETERGYKNFINLIGIESPGFTSCLSIANYVNKLIKE